MIITVISSTCSSTSIFIGVHESTSQTIYKQLLLVQIPKAQKDTDELTVFFALLGSVHLKALSKHVVEIDPVFSIPLNAEYFQLFTIDVTLC